jgi:hypothetical protein
LCGDNEEALSTVVGALLSSFPEKVKIGQELPLFGLIVSLATACGGLLNNLTLSVETSAGATSTMELDVACVPALIALLCGYSGQAGDAGQDEKGAALMALAAVVDHCGTLLQFDSVLPWVEKWLSFDPNLVADERMGQAKVMEEDDDMDGFDELSDGDDEVTGSAVATLEHDDSWKVRFAACKCLGAFVQALVRNANDSKSRSGVYLRHAPIAARLLARVLGVMGRRLSGERQPTVLLGLLDALGSTLDLRETTTHDDLHAVGLGTALMGIIERSKGSGPRAVEAACGVLHRLLRLPSALGVIDKLVSAAGATVAAALDADVDAVSWDSGSQRALLALFEALLILFGARLLPLVSEASVGKLVHLCATGEEGVATAALGAIRAAASMVSGCETQSLEAPYAETRRLIHRDEMSTSNAAMLDRVFSGVITGVLQKKGVGVNLRAAALSCLPSLLTRVTDDVVGVSEGGRDGIGVTLWQVLRELEGFLGSSLPLPVRLVGVTAVWSACAHTLGSEGNERDIGGDNDSRALLIRVVVLVRGCLRHANAGLRSTALRCLHVIACRCSR